MLYLLLQNCDKYIPLDTFINWVKAKVPILYAGSIYLHCSVKLPIYIRVAIEPAVRMRSTTIGTYCHKGLFERSNCFPPLVSVFALN